MPHSAESFRRGKPLVFINFGYRKSLDKWVGVSNFSVEKFMPHSAEVFHRGETFSVSLIWGIEKVWIRVGGGVPRFSFEVFLPHSDEKFRRGEPFSPLLFSGIGKFCVREGGVSKISVES